MTARAAGRGPGAVPVIALAAAALVALPMLVIVAGLLRPAGGTWSRLWDTILPEAILNTVLLALGVGVGTLVIGTGLAALVVFFDFPGRRVFEWALVLPLAMPGYVLTFVLLREWDGAGAVPGTLRAVFGDDALRSLPAPSWCCHWCCTRTCTCSRAARCRGSRGVSWRSLRASG